MLYRNWIQVFRIMIAQEKQPPKYTKHSTLERLNAAYWNNLSLKLPHWWLQFVAVCFFIFWLTNTFPFNNRIAIYDFAVKNSLLQSLIRKFCGIYTFLNVVSRNATYQSLCVASYEPPPRHLLFGTPSLTSLPLQRMHLPVVTHTKYPLTCKNPQTDALSFGRETIVSFLFLWLLP